ncbi:hypothetical protein ES705_15747 [subsurface metagenome]
MYLTIIISVCPIFELFGGILLASEMIGLLDKIRKWNSLLQNKIQSRKIELAAIGLAAGLLYMVVDVIKKFHLRTVLDLLYSVFFLYIAIIIFLISGELLHFLEYLTEKLGTKRVLGVLGVIFLCVGFVCQAFINFTTN